MANHETHSVIAGGIESDLHIDSSKYPHPFCSLLQKRAHFDSFKHLIFIRGLLASKRLVRTVLIFTESSDQLSRATDRVP
ncbi:hypothetical protein N4758_20215, partial [Escherichia coli]|nr:hypothetical protein [Escherichia coli]MCU7030623.1 hypothetical protein [Escherichia coli]